MEATEKLKTFSELITSDKPVLVDFLPNGVRHVK